MSDRWWIIDDGRIQPQQYWVVDDKYGVDHGPFHDYDTARSFLEEEADYDEHSEI